MFASEAASIVIDAGCAVGKDKSYINQLCLVKLIAPKHTGGIFTQTQISRDQEIIIAGFQQAQLVEEIIVGSSAHDIARVLQVSVDHEHARHCDDESTHGCIRGGILTNKKGGLQGPPSVNFPLRAANQA